MKEISICFYSKVIKITLLCLCLMEIPVFARSAGVNLITRAVPVWVAGREKEMNLTLGFRGVFQAMKGQNYQLKITASTIYRVFLNGEFLGYGPARAAHGYFRVDEYAMGKYVRAGENILAMEVAGYNVNSYYLLDQPSFLLAEIESGGKVVLATGREGDFIAFQPGQRLQKVERYSFQRPFTEYYRLKNEGDQWKTSSKSGFVSLAMANQPAVKLLPRNLLLPEFSCVFPKSVCSTGIVQYQKPGKYRKDRSLTQIGPKFKGYKESELEVTPSQIIQEITNKSQDSTVRPYVPDKINLAENQFATFDFGTNLSGFIGGRILCSEPSILVFYFDEMLTAGDVNTKKRMSDVNNQVVYEMDPGEYSLETFEPYTFKYLKVIVLKGKCRLKEISLREYAYPGNSLASFHSSNDKLNDIYRAARQTFRQNAVDILTDCPSRERAGWLCDSYFSAIMEKDFTGKSAVAHNFYENYALPESFDFLPPGMIPMCYPADHNDSVFIPNWALWFIIQVDDYARRGGDPVLVSQLKPRVEKLLNYFKGFENEDGLLEKLDSWIFVEWSKANSFVRDVNYPTNMLYCDALSKAAHLYHNDAWQKKAEDIRQTVLRQSYNGTFFVDNAVRDLSGKLRVTNNTTEVCQYYAFFFNVATPGTHPDLWKKLIAEFGPNRNISATYPLVFKANAFVGNYLRMDILSRYGLQSQLVKEIQDYFHYMAQRTGTLWENTDSSASCDHGFASYIGHVLYRDVLGISQIDYLSRVVTVRFSDNELTHCSGVIPVGDSSVDLKWERTGNQIKYSIKVPAGYQVKVDNLSASELVRAERIRD